MIKFSERVELADKYQNWFDDNYRIDEYRTLNDDHLTLITYLESNNLLDEKRVKEFIKGSDIE